MPLKKGVMPTFLFLLFPAALAAITRGQPEPDVNAYDFGRQTSRPLT
jgi:hypothetical protein